MSRPFPKPKDKYPIVYLKDTDVELPKHVVNKNNTRYIFLRRIAKGGKCTIQAFKDLHLSRVVCYKSLLPEIADDPFEQQRFLREARVTAMLQHPNTIPTYELSRDRSGHYFFTMKLVEGSTLREILDLIKSGSAESDEYRLDRLIEILIQVGQALDYAHNHGVVHRDVKPANILIGPFGEVLLLDWGLAKVWGSEDEVIPEMPRVDTKDRSLTAQGQLQGTAIYMSPEQIARSKDIDHRTDIYSLGAVLYEVLTLEEMAWGDTLDELLGHTQNDPPPRPSEKAPNRFIPSELEEICMQCVEKDPNDRIQSAPEVLSRLQAWRSTNAA